MVKKLQKRLIVLLLLAAVLVGNLGGNGIVVYAAGRASGTIGQVQWELDAQGTLVFRGNGAFPSFQSINIPWRDYKWDIKAVSFEMTNVTDGDLTNYFEGCSNLQSVSDLPEGVRNLTQTFRKCSSLRLIGKIPVSTETMERTFEKCTSLNQTIKIPKNVKNMQGLFQGCTALTRLPQIETTLVKDYSYLLQETAITEPLSIPSGVTNVTGMFSLCKKLTSSPVLPESVTEAAQCFYGCEALKKAPALPRKIENISQIFAECVNLTAVPDIPPSVVNMSGCYANCCRAKGSFTIYAIINDESKYTKLAGTTAKDDSSVKGQFLGAAGGGLSVNYTVGNEHLIREYLSTGWNSGNLHFAGYWGNLNIGDKVAQKMEDCTVSPVPDVNYTGKAICPVPKVYYGNIQLTEKTDYTISYSNNTNAGTAAVAITGVGNYSGTKKVSFVIRKISMTGVAAQNYQGIYDGKAHGITLQVPAGVTATYGTKSGEYTLKTAPVYTLPGNYTVYYQVTKPNYITVTGSAKVSIVQGTMPVVANGYSGIYDGKSHGITVEGLAGAQIRYGTAAGQYTSVESPKYKDTGIYTVYYQVTKTGYGTVTGKQQIEIKRKVITEVTFPKTSQAVYGTTLAKIPSTSMSMQDSLGVFSWDNPLYVPTVDDTQAKMWYKPYDKKNYDYSRVKGYDAGSGNIVRNITISIQRKKGELPQVTTGFLAQGDELEKSKITWDKLDVGDFYWAKPEEKASQDKSEYTLIFRPKDMRNYDWSYLSSKELDWNTFQIWQKVEVVPYPEPVEIVYGDTLGSKGFVGKNPEVKYRWLDENVIPGKTGSHKLKIIYQGQEIVRNMEVVVLKRKPDYVIPVLDAVCYDPELTLGQISLPRGWNWSDPSVVPEAGQQNYEAYYEPEDPEHYQTVYDKIPLMVEKAVPSVNVPYIQTQIEEDTICLKEIGLPMGWRWQNPEESFGEGVYEVSVVYEPEDPNNYSLWEGQITIDIKKKIQPTEVPEETPIPTETPVPVEIPETFAPHPPESPVSSPTTSPTTSPSVIPAPTETSGTSASQPTSSPTTAPIASPTADPIAGPAASPMTSPDVSPVSSPTTSPTTSPSVIPAPTETSGTSASQPTSSPTVAPIVSPTTAPTSSPTIAPIVSPTAGPAASPISDPMTSPSVTPTPTETSGTPLPQPTDGSIPNPSVNPTAGPTQGHPFVEMPKITSSLEATQTMATQKPAGNASKADSPQKDAVISLSNKGKPKESSLYGVKKQKKAVGKVHLKKVVYRKKKIYLTWKKVKNARGYQVVFLKRKKGRTRMFKYTQKSKMILSWNGVGKCFVKMRAFHNRGKKRVYGSWSACKRVKRS